MVRIHHSATDKVPSYTALMLHTFNSKSGSLVSPVYLTLFMLYEVTLNSIHQTDMDGLSNVLRI